MGAIVILVLLAVGLTVYGSVQLREAARLATGPVPDPAPVAAAASPSSSARQILDERYARGEIDTDEYLHRVETLRRADGWVPLAPAGSEGPAAPVGAGAGDGEPARPEEQV